MTDQTDTPPARDERKFKTITLEEPIKRGDTEIAMITLRKPTAGELRGLTLEALLTSQVDALLTLIPRISDPNLIDQEVSAMDPIDFAECGGAVRGFFMNKRQRAMMERLVAEQGGAPTSVN